MYRICIFYLYDPSLVCCKALRSNKVEEGKPRLTNLYKTVSGTLAVVIPNYFRQKKRQTRNYYPLKFVDAGCRTSIYKYSFFPRTVKE